MYYVINANCFVFSFVGGIFFCLVTVLALRSWKSAKKPDTVQGTWSSQASRAFCDLADTATDFHLSVLEPCFVGKVEDWRNTARQKIEDFVRDYECFLEAGGDSDLIWNLLPGDDLELPECVSSSEDLRTYLLAYVSIIEDKRRR